MLVNVREMTRDVVQIIHREFLDENLSLAVEERVRRVLVAIHLHSSHMTLLRCVDVNLQLNE